MGKRQKLKVIGVLCVVVVVGGAAGLYVHLGKRGTSRLEQWIGQQIVGVVEAHLNCTAKFETLDYQAPKTVEVTGLSLARDGNEFVGASRMLIELGERPRLAEPIRIALVEVDDPHLTFKAAPGGGFVGWNNLVRSAVVENPDSVAVGKRLSDVLVLRHVEVKNGQLVYEPADGKAAMKLTGLGFAMDTVPEAHDPAWYTLQGAFRHAGLSEFKAEARLNLDTAVVEIKRIEGTLTLDKEQYATLPPPVQELLRQHDVRGSLTLGVSGRVPLKDFLGAELAVRAVLTDAYASFDEYKLPITRIDVSVEMADRNVEATLAAELLGGDIDGRANIGLAEAMPIDASWKLESIEIKEMLPDAVQEGASQYAGKVFISGSAKAQLKDMPASLSGSGVFNVTEGNLTFLPGFMDLVRTVTLDASFAQPSFAHKASGDYVIGPQAVRIEHLEIETDWMAAHGSGEIGFDGLIDFDINAGPLEKLQGKLGFAGRIFGGITDRIVTYRVHGPMMKPTISVKPFG
ncbi:MAG TPA: AsmA-like C-terminal region-containing protein [Phycisphaerae bacterium]|nr:AsmA-like C-terminal region-containing protein [Phycisphaerae bacterium]HNU46472.1 AsmA-like C-terminal region-containing protein [Phycisphaerae bacterium]